MKAVGIIPCGFVFLFGQTELRAFAFKEIEAQVANVGHHGGFIALADTAGICREGGIQF